MIHHIAIAAIVLPRWARMCRNEGAHLAGIALSGALAGARRAMYQRNGQQYPTHL